MPHALVIHAARDLRVEDLPSETPGPGQLRVQLRAGGICGSDLHYYQHGGFGTVRVKQPMVLGHEVSGMVLESGAGVQGFPSGARIAISPSRPCGHCGLAARRAGRAAAGPASAPGRPPPAGLHLGCARLRGWGSQEDDETSRGRGVGSQRASVVPPGTGMADSLSMMPRKATSWPSPWS